MTVRWLRMSLSGFGRFQSTVTVDWHEGINVLVAPNESGKSTLMAGLAAILFGLPTSSNADEFGQARYRNWHHPPAFDGVLEFASGGDTYRVRRVFDSHAIRVSMRTADGWIEYMTGEHNPRAHRPNRRYEQFLRQTVGLTSRELFTGTFAFTQPLPEARQLDRHVQGLVSGAGTANYGEALQALAAYGRRLTKFTKQFGFSSRDAHNDGEIEVIGKRIAELRAGIEASRESVDLGRALQQQVADLQGEIELTREQLRETETLITAWNQWRDLREKHRAKLQEQSRLQRAWTAFHQLEADMSAGRRQLLEQFPEMADTPATTGDALDELERLLDAVRAARAQLATEMAGVYRRAGELREEWVQFASERKRLQSLQHDLKQQFAAFEDADDGAMRHYAAHDATKASLEGRVVQARQRLARLEEERAALAASQARFDEMYGDLDGVDDDAGDAIDERIRNLAKRDELAAEYERKRRAHESVRRRRLTAGAAVAVVALAVAAAGIALTAPPLFVILAALVAGGAAVVAGMSWLRTASNPDLESVAEQLCAVEDELGADPRLGPWSGAPAHQLGALRERLSARQQAAASLADQATAVSSDDDEESVRRELAEATDALQRFLQSTEVGRRQFGDDLEGAFKRWQERRDQASEALRAVRSFSLRHFGSETLTPESMAVADLPDGGVPAVWRSIARFVQDAGLIPSDDGTSSRDAIFSGDAVSSGHAVSSGDASSSRDTVSPGDAITIGHVVDALDALTDAHIDAVVAVRARERADIVHRETQISELRAQLAGVLAAADDDVVGAKRRWEQYQRRLGTITGLKEQQAGVLAGFGAESEDDLHERSIQASNVAMDAYKDMEKLAAHHAFLPPADEPYDATALHATLTELHARRDELRNVLAQQERQFLSLSQRQAELAGAGVLNVAGAEEELEELEQRRAELMTDVRVVALAHEELGLAVESYQQTHRQLLAERASRYLEQFTGRRRQVVLDEHFAVSVQQHDGPLHSVTQLSQGAQDQLYLALRLAIADLVSDDVALPLLLDDPFVHCDDERLRRIREALSAVAADRQVILLAHRDVFGDWGREVSLQVGSLQQGAIEPGGEHG